MQSGLLRSGPTMASMLSDVIGDLVCPVCRDGVAQSGGAVRCAEGHSFDLARQGYVSMLGDRPFRGDDAGMVAARARFLSTGHFDPIAGAVSEAAAACAGPGCIVDFGAGTGHYLAHVLGRLPGRRGIALDASAAALRRAARCHERAGAVACDVWSRVPVGSGRAGLVLDVFAPRNGAEMRRVLTPSGALVVVTPTPRHLNELVGSLELLQVDADKETRVAVALSEWFEEIATRTVEHLMHLDRVAVTDLVAMGPSARHVTPDLSRLPDPATVTASVTVSAYRPRP